MINGFEYVKDKMGEPIFRVFEPLVEEVFDLYTVWEEVVSIAGITKNVETVNRIAPGNKHSFSESVGWLRISTLLL